MAEVALAAAAVEAPTKLAQPCLQEYDGVSSTDSEGEDQSSETTSPEASSPGSKPKAAGPEAEQQVSAIGLHLAALPSATRRLDPLEVRFSQMKMRHLFGDGRRVADTVAQIRVVRTTEEEQKEYGVNWRLVVPFPVIEVIRWHCKLRDETTGRPKVDPKTGEDVLDSEEHWFTLDNRRLYCLQEAALRVWPERAVADVAVILSGPHKQMRELRKFRTLDKGRSVVIGSRANGVSFVRWSWRAKAGIEEPSEEEGEFLALKAEGLPVERRPKGDVLEHLSSVKADDDKRIELSKRISWVLRRGAKISGIRMDDEGWVKVQDLPTAECLKGISIPKLLSVVEESNKQKFRYDLKDDQVRGQLIRASGKKAVGNSQGGQRDADWPSAAAVRTPAPPIGAPPPAPPPPAATGPTGQPAVPPGIHLRPAAKAVPAAGRGAVGSGGSAVRGPVAPGAVGGSTPIIRSPAAAAAAAAAVAVASPTNGGAKGAKAKAVPANLSSRAGSSPTAAGTPSAAALTTALAAAARSNDPRLQLWARSLGALRHPAANASPMAHLQFMQLMHQMQAFHQMLAISSTYQMQVRLQMQELMRLRMLQQMHFMSGLQQAQMLQEMEAMWGGMPTGSPLAAAGFGPPGFFGVPDMGGGLDGIGAVEEDGAEAFDPASMTAEEIEARFAEVLQAAQERLAAGASAAEGQADFVAERRQPPRQPPPPAGPADLQARIEETLKAAKLRSSTSEQPPASALPVTQKPATQAKSAPSAPSAPLDKESLEAKAQAALAAARARSGAAGGRPTSPEGTGPKSAAVITPASSAALQAKIVEALEAARARHGSAAAAF